MHMTEPSWGKFFATYKAMLCPSCTRAGRSHCVHQALYRNGNLVQAAVRRSPSHIRDELCDKLWGELERRGAIAPDADPEEVATAQRALDVMAGRAAGVPNAYHAQ